MKDDDLQVPPALLTAIFNTDCAFLNVLHEHDNGGPAPRVPLEILEVIFDLFWDDVAGVGTLASVAQACRAFSHHVTPTLYDTVMLHSSPTLDTRVGRFATTVTSNAHLASLVDPTPSQRPATYWVSTLPFLAHANVSRLWTLTRTRSFRPRHPSPVSPFGNITRVPGSTVHRRYASFIHVDGIYTAARNSCLGILHPTFHPHVFPRLITLSGFFDHTTNEHHALGHVYAFLAQALRAPVLKKAALFVETSGIPNINIDQHYAIRSDEERVLLCEKLLIIEIDDTERIQSNIRMSVLDGDSIFSFGKRTLPF